MTIYLAHNFAARAWLKRHVIPKIEELRHIVTAEWITDDSHLSHEKQRESAEADVRNITQADAFILFTDPFSDRHGKGKFMELGIALALGKRIFLCGDDLTSSVFYYLPQITRCASIDGLLDALTANSAKDLIQRDGKSRLRDSRKATGEKY